jgi:hypothetical protein
VWKYLKTRRAVQAVSSQCTTAATSSCSPSRESNPLHYARPRTKASNCRRHWWRCGGRHYWSYAAVLVEERDHETGAMATHEEASQPRCHCSVLRIESLAVENDTDPAITRRPIIHIYIHERGKQRSKSKRSRSYVYHSNTCILLYSPTCVGDSSLVSNICVVLPLA